MEDSGHSQELQNPNMELKAYLLDWRLKDRDGKDLDNFEDVVPRADKGWCTSGIKFVQFKSRCHRRANSNVYSKAVYVYDGAYSYVNTKAFTEHALNQGRTETVLGKSSTHIYVPRK